MLPVVNLGAVFTLFFITLGPLKLLGPFAQQTQTYDVAALRGLALRAFVIGLIAVLVAGYVGTALAADWDVSAPAILISTGIIFFLVAIGLVMAPYAEAQPVARPLPAQPMAATLHVVFPLVVTPYGVAALIAVMTSAVPGDHTKIYLLLLTVMILNLLAMLFVRQIMRGPMLLVLQLLGAVLGVLQVGLAVQIIIRGLRELHVLTV
jgi:multiple antibiotic resistance protein